MKELLRILGGTALLTGILLTFLPTTETTTLKQVEQLEDQLNTANKKIQQLEKTDSQIKSTNQLPPQKKTYTLRIARGMDSTAVLNQLVEAAIITDADSFEIELAKQQAASKIQIGEYEVTSEMSNQELIQLITKTKN